MSWFPRSEMKLVPSAQQVSGAPCKNRQLRFVALLFKVSERSITPVSIALCLQTPMKKQSASFHCCQAASHAHQRCHATHLRFWACVAFRLTEVNPHTLSLADLQSCAFPGTAIQSMACRSCFFISAAMVCAAMVSTDIAFVPTFSEAGAKCKMHPDQPTKRRPWIAGVKFVQKNLLFAWF